MAKVIEREKKTSEQIKQRILEELDKQQKPLSIQDIGKEIGSNWLTAKEYIKELQQERKIKEIILGGKRLFRLVREDTYLDVPITKPEKEKFYFLFDNAKKIFKEKGIENPKKIQIQKSIVNVIDKFNIQVPTVWYLYGKMTLMKYEPEKDYSQYTIKIENQNEIINYMKGVISEVVKLNWTKAICKSQYCAYDKSLYQKKEEIYEILSDDLDKNKEELRKKVVEMYFSFPTNEDSLRINSLIHEFEILIGKMILLPDLNKYKKVILETFDAVWKMTAIYMFYESLTKYPRFKDKEEIKSIYLEDSINNKISIAEEIISDLEIEYLNSLSEIEEPPKFEDNKLTDLMKTVISEMEQEGVEKNGSVS